MDTENILEYYKTHTGKQTQKQFNISYRKLHKILSENNVVPHSTSWGTHTALREKYGVDNPNKINGATERAKNTRLLKYGNANYCNVDKIRHTKLERYGNASYVNPEKAKKTNLNRYGTECSLHNDEVAEKVKATNIAKYGSEVYFTTDDFKEKMKDKQSVRLQKTQQTCLQKYGAHSWFSSDAGKAEIKKIMQEKYGVDYFCQTPMVRNYTSNSKPNQYFAQQLENNNISFEREFSIENRQYDFKVGNILIEINPTATHNSDWGILGNPGITKTYHKEKSDIAFMHGYRCIQVWDWDNLEKIIFLLKESQSSEVIYARNCTIQILSIESEKEFLQNYHLQGYVKSEICLGLMYEGNVAAVMTFGKPRYNRNYQYELLRYCCNAHIVGGAQKLFKHFIKMMHPESIISYCDKSKFNGNVYLSLGFTSSSTNVTPSCHWYNIKTHRHITDNLLRQRGFDQLLGSEYGVFGKGTSNEHLMLQAGFVRIFDCGQESFVWVNNK